MAEKERKGKVAREGREGGREGYAILLGTNSRSSNEGSEAQTEPRPRHT